MVPGHRHEWARKVRHDTELLRLKLLPVLALPDGDAAPWGSSVRQSGRMQRLGEGMKKGGADGNGIKGKGTEKKKAARFGSS
jgi:hypothetical protein